MVRIIRDCTLKAFSYWNEKTLSRTLLERLNTCTYLNQLKNRKDYSGADEAAAAADDDNNVDDIDDNDNDNEGGDATSRIYCILWRRWLWYFSLCLIIWYCFVFF